MQIVQYIWGFSHNFQSFFANRVWVKGVYCIKWELTNTLAATQFFKSEAIFLTEKTWEWGHKSIIVLQTLWMTQKMYLLGLIFKTS